MSDTALPAIIRFDTTANRIAFTPAPGVVEQLYIWLDSDDQPNAYYWDSATWQPLNVIPGLNIKTIGITIDGGGAVISTGIKGDIYCPFDGTITGVVMLADQTGSIVVNVWKDVYANYPPDVADKITASAPPTITTGVKSLDTTLTGWTTSIAAGDTIRFNVDSVTTIQRVTLQLLVSVNP